MQDFCQSRRWQFCFIGGVALQRWGNPRLTVDVDLTLFTGFRSELEIIDDILKEFESRVEDARKFAIENRVLLLLAKNKTAIDMSLAGFPYEQLVCQRATEYHYPKSATLRTCSAEDLIVLKAFADRGQDWVDVDGVIARNIKKKLDWSYIMQHLTELCQLKESPEIVSKLQKLRDSYSQP